MQDTPSFHFGPYRLDPDDQRLWHGHQVVRLTSKAFQVLLQLVSRPQQLVTKDDLFAAVWPDTVVSDAALTSAIGELRRAFQDDPRRPTYIETVHRRGYRFMAEVERRSQTTPAPSDVAPSVPLTRLCPFCHCPNAQEASFCNACAAPLDEKPPGTVAPLISAVLSPQDEALVVGVAPWPHAERRQLTVMLCDLVDSTNLSSQLDPEDLRDIMHAYHSACDVVIQRFDGYIAQILGDGLLIYFGYPRAHEDDAPRAVWAGLGMVEAIAALNARLSPEQEVCLAVRIGIHTGLVVVGEVGSQSKQEHLAMGATPNVASRLLGVAAPDTIVISAATAQLVLGYFDCESLGEQALRGVPEPMTIYRVLRDSGVQSRLEVAPVLTPLVGRTAEITFLLDRWEQTQAGLGQVVLLSGEPGMGKSRLVQVIKDHVADSRHPYLECRSSPYYQNTAFYPIIDLLEREAGFHGDDPPEVKLDKLERAFNQSQRLSDSLSLFASLLSLPLPEMRSPSLNLSPQQLRQQILEATVAMLLERAERQPHLFIVEDLHWADPTTLEFLELLVSQSPTSSLLILLTCRPEFQSPWRQRSSLTGITLIRLSDPQVEEMIQRLTDETPLPTEVVQQIIANTDGVPLFIEEVTKSLLESGYLQAANGHYELRGPLPTLAIPTTLQDSLTARLDRLVSAKRIAQIGATIGRQFTYELLRAVATVDEQVLCHELGLLVEAALIYQRGVPPHSTYLFKHALVQDAAYVSQLKSQREQLHLTIAQVLEAQFPTLVEAEPEVVAYHYTEANRHGQALPYWQRAGERAIQSSANLEAIAHLSKGLDVLVTLPDTRERVQQELILTATLGVPLIATKGFGAPEVERAYSRSRELCRQVGNTPQLAPVLFGLWAFYVVRAELQTAHELGEQLLHLAHRQQDPGLLLEGHLCVGITLFFLAEFAPARAHLEQSLSLYDPKEHAMHAVQYGQDPRVAALTFLAWPLWCLGYPDQAWKRSRESVTTAQTLLHPFSLGWALIIVINLALWCRDTRTVQERTAGFLELSEEHAFALFMSFCTISQGWLHATQGKGEEGRVQMRQGIAAWEALGTEVWRAHYLTLLAESYGKERHTAEGLTLVAEALAAVEHTGERVWESELYRLKGELLLIPPGSDIQQAQLCLQHALNIARRQQAKSLELRAATSLARLWQSQDKRQDAYDLFAPVYEWFTEGFDTADLIDAKKLFDELSIGQRLGIVV